MHCRGFELDIITTFLYVKTNKKGWLSIRIDGALTRARPVVLAKHERSGGGLISAPPPKISKTKQRRDMRQTALDRPSSELQNLLR